MARYQGPLEQAQNYARLGKPNPYVESASKLAQVETRRLRDAGLASAYDDLASTDQRRLGDVLSIAGLALAAAGAIWMIMQDDDRIVGIVIAVLCFVLVPLALWSSLTRSRQLPRRPPSRR
jgi:hypothetical protein